MPNIAAISTLESRAPTMAGTFIATAAATAFPLARLLGCLSA